MDACWETRAQSLSEAKMQNFAGAEFRLDGPVREGGDAVDIPPTQARLRPVPGWGKFSCSSPQHEILHQPSGPVGTEVESVLRPPSGPNATKPQQVPTDPTQLPEVFQELLKRSSASTELMIKAYDDKLRDVKDEVSQLKQAYAELFKSELSTVKCELSAMRNDFETLFLEDPLLPDMSERISLSVMRKDLDEVRALALCIGKATTGAAADWDLRTCCSSSLTAINEGLLRERTSCSSSLTAMNEGLLRERTSCSSPPAPPPPGAIDFFMEFDRTQGKLGIEVDSSDGTSLLVTAIHEGLLREWNGLHPEESIMPGDRVVAVGGCGGDAPFLLAGAERFGMVKLTVRRYAKSERDRFLAKRTNSKEL